MKPYLLETLKELALLGAIKNKIEISSFELAKIASAAKPALLVLYHQLFWHLNDKKIVEEIKESYDGKVVSGKDLEFY